ncbi:MAG: sigma-70 family RNA polymerase sigma factor [Bacteroidota bacterium]
MVVVNQPSERMKEDAFLVQKFLQEGDESAWNKLHKKYKDSLYMVCLKIVHSREDAEDVLSATFIKAYKNLDKYSTDFAFSTWIHKIASNASIDFLRNKKLKGITVQVDTNADNDDEKPQSVEIADKEITPDTKLMKEQFYAKLRDAIKVLKPHYQDLLEMRFFQEKSYEEIGTELGLVSGTLKGQLNRAKEALLVEMKKRGLDALYLD